VLRWTILCLILVSCLHGGSPGQDGAIQADGDCITQENEPDWYEDYCRHLWPEDTREMNNE
jgi:hypothetical protein